MYNDLTRFRVAATTLPDMLLAAADRVGERKALIFPESFQTYAELVEAAYVQAARLRGLGVGPGDHVGILMANCPEYVELLFGITLLGATAVPLNARYKAMELAYVVENADLKVLVTSDLIADYANFKNLLLEGIEGLAESPGPELQLAAPPRLRHVVLLGADHHPAMLDERAFNQAAEGVQRQDIDRLRVSIRLEDAAIMMYTSGTTAHPKGCPLGHGLLTRNGMNMNRSRYFLNEQDVFWAPLPMFHMSSTLPMLACLDAGAAMASMVHVEAGTALAMLQRDGATIAFPSFPTVTNDLINHADFATTDLSRLRRINNVAPIEMLRRFQEAFPQAVQTGAYGLTEAGGVVAYNHPDESLDERLHTCGHPMPGIDVRITDPETLEPLPAGERGEIWIRGYCVFQGYYKSPEKNAEAFHEGWFRTGDLCSLTEDGAIQYHGRIKDMLKVGGENVAALEIESHLARHPGVALAQVIGRPDDRLWEVPVAFIERVPGSEVSEADLEAHCRGQLASFKVPRAFYFVESWPMSSTKVQKFKLREQLTEASS